MQSKGRLLLSSLKGKAISDSNRKITFQMFGRGGGGEGEIICVKCLLFALVW